MKKQKKKFSIIVPVYNIKEYLTTCVNSVLNQKFKEFELILIDDGSNDGSGELCMFFAKKDSRIKVIRERNKGQSAARNRGIEIAEGEYIIFLDGDDFWQGEILEDLSKKIVRNPEIIVFNYSYYNEESKKAVKANHEHKLNYLKNMEYTGEKILEELLKYNPIYQWYPVLYAYNRNFFCKYGFAFENGTKYEDVKLIYQIILKAKKVVIQDKKYYMYRFNRDASTTNTLKLKTEENKIDVIESCIDSVQNSQLSNHLKKLLCNNFSINFFSSIGLLYFFDKKDRTELYEKLKAKSYKICSFSTVVIYKYMYLFTKIFGIRPLAIMLYLRNCICYRKRNKKIRKE